MINFKNIIVRNIFNILGWRTSRHLLIIESDDWGAIRMPSKRVHDYLKKQGVPFGKLGYDEYDSIASKEDLELLFEICLKYKDINNHPLVITANAVTANPDFPKIKETDFMEYYYEPITETMERYYPGNSPFLTWIHGINEKVFYPQFHGREHVNALMWLNCLKNDYEGFRLAFENGVYSVLVSSQIDNREKNTSALNYQTEKEMLFVLDSIRDGLKIFQKLFGFTSKSFIAPAYKWDENIEQELAKNGVMFLQGKHTHYSQGKKKYTYIGRKNRFGQFYLNRQANFEYTLAPNYNWNDLCLRDIAAAFRWHKPATISAHRVNFIGAINPKQRDINLKRFDQLISNIIRKWPDIEFLTTPELGECIYNDYIIK